MWFEPPKKYQTHTQKKKITKKIPPKNQKKLSSKDLNFKTLSLLVLYI